MEINIPILASGSPYRRAMLLAAGVGVDVRVPEVDETAAKQEMVRMHPRPEPASVALHLAGLKAIAVSRESGNNLVIGADQVLAFEGEIFSKPGSLEEARRQLVRLRGNSHELVTAVVLVERGRSVWSHISSARLLMRPFTDDFLDAYISRQGTRLLSTVGAYEVEGFGSQLFESIDGDHFTIIGLPLLPLMAELRRRGVLAD